MDPAIGKFTELDPDARVVIEQAGCNRVRVSWRACGRSGQVEQLTAPLALHDALAAAQVATARD